MKEQEHYDNAEELAADVHKPLSQEDALGTGPAGQERSVIPAPGIVPPGVSKPRLPGVGPLPGS